MAQYRFQTMIILLIVKSKQLLLKIFIFSFFKHSNYIFDHFYLDKK